MAKVVRVVSQILYINRKDSLRVVIQVSELKQSMGEIQSSDVYTEQCHVMDPDFRKRKWPAIGN